MEISVGDGVEWLNSLDPFGESYGLHYINRIGNNEGLFNGFGIYVWSN